MERHNFFELNDSESWKKNRAGSRARQPEQPASKAPEAEAQGIRAKEAVPSDAEKPHDRRYPPLMPLEGTISWRDQEISSQTPEKPKPVVEDDDDDDEEEEEKQVVGPAPEDKDEPRADKETPVSSDKDDRGGAEPLRPRETVPLPEALTDEADTDEPEADAETNPRAIPDAAGTETVGNGFAPLPEFARADLTELPPIASREKSPLPDSSQEQPKETFTATVPFPERIPVSRDKDGKLKEPGDETDSIAEETERQAADDNEADDAGYQTEEPSGAASGGIGGGGYGRPYEYGPRPSDPMETEISLHESTVEYRDRPHTHGGILALLGLEYFARKRADSKMERRVEERLGDDMREQAQVQAQRFERLERQQREAAEQQRYYRTHEAQQRRYESLHGVKPETTPLAEQQPVPVEAEEKQREETRPIRMQPGQHLEHSTWHNIVVDHRGREVMGAIKYGEGFQGERHKEINQSELFTPPASSHTAGGLPTVPGPSSLPISRTTPTLPSGSAPAGDAQQRIKEQQKAADIVPGVSNGWLWTMILIILAAFFIAAFL